MLDFPNQRRIFLLYLFLCLHLAIYFISASVFPIHAWLYKFALQICITHPAHKWKLQEREWGCFWGRWCCPNWWWVTYMPNAPSKWIEWEMPLLFPSSSSPSTRKNDHQPQHHFFFYSIFFYSRLMITRFTVYRNELSSILSRYSSIYHSHYLFIYPLFIWNKFLIHFLFLYVILFFF